MKSRKHRELQTRWTHKRPTPRHIVIKMPNVKDKQRILKSARGKISYLQGSSHKTADFLK